MSDFVLDASAILAVLLAQPAGSEILELIPESLVSAVNVAEVVGRLSEAGTSVDRVHGLLGGLNLVVVPFDSGDAWATGLLRRRTRHERLSLGDRACLALAISRGLPALTTDGAWARLGLGKTVRVVGR